MRSLARSVRRQMLIDQPTPLHRSIAPDALQTGEALCAAQGRLRSCQGDRDAIAEMTAAEALHREALRAEYGGHRARRSDLVPA